MHKKFDKGQIDLIYVMILLIETFGKKNFFTLLNSGHISVKGLEAACVVNKYITGDANELNEHYD